MTRALVPEDISDAATRRSVVRAVTAQVLGALRQEEPARILERAWGGDHRAALVLRAAVSPTTVADFTNAYPPSTTWLMPALAPGSAALKLFNACLLLDLAGVVSIRVGPSIVARPSVAFVAEGQAAPAVQFQFGSGVVLGPLKKLLCLAVASNELAKASNGIAELVIGRTISEAIETQLDSVVFGSGAATAGQPAGLLRNIVPLPPSANTGLEGMADDVSAIAGAIAANGINPDDMILVASPELAAKLRLLASDKFTNTVLSTLALPAKTITGFAPGGIAAAHEGQPTIEASKQTLVVLTDPGQPFSDGAGVLGAPAQSVFQQDGVVLRVRQRATWTPLRPEAVQVIADVNW